MPIDVNAQIAIALPAMAAARDAAALPLKFTTQAADDSDDRSRGQFTANLPLIDEKNLPAVMEGLIEASRLYGTLATAIAQFAGATEISLEHAQLARLTAERACKVRVATKLSKTTAEVKASDGIPCA